MEPPAVSEPTETRALVISRKEGRRVRMTIVVLAADDDDDGEGD